jgi:hypothetical protein
MCLCVGLLFAMAVCCSSLFSLSVTSNDDDDDDDDGVVVDMLYEALKEIERLA